MSSTLRLRRIASAFLLAGMVAPGWASAQNPSLAEIARKEQERRKATKSSDKVLTNKDLPPSASRPAAPAGATAPAAAETPQPAAEQKAPGEEKDEAWWKQRIQQARENLRRSQAFLEALQSRVNSLSADFVNRDDPAQRAKIGEDRQKALAEMERVQAEIALYKKQIEDIDEEARKAGVPPGWLR